MERFRLTSMVAAAALAAGTALGISGAHAIVSANGMEAQGVSGNAVAAGPFEFNDVSPEPVQLTEKQLERGRAGLSSRGNNNPNYPSLVGSGGSTYPWPVALAIPTRVRNG